MKRICIRMGELAEPKKYPATVVLYRETLAWLRGTRES